MPENPDACGGGEEESDFWEFLWAVVDSITGQATQELVQLERVTVNGTSTCGIWVGAEGSESFADLSDCTLGSLMPGEIEEIDRATSDSREDLEEVVVTLAKKLNICPVATAASFDSDAPYYLAATEAIKVAVPGSLTAGTQVEVMYQNGRSYTFEIIIDKVGNWPFHIAHKYTGGGLNPKCIL